jgi:glycosyltransferase involved in cell wall biosynthesis
MNKKKIIYIAEFSLPNMSAYAVHVLKMCDNFCKYAKVELVIPYRESSYHFKKIKREYLLKKNFKIKSIFSSKKKLNFFNRILFSLKIYNYLNQNNYKMIISRAIMPSLILAIMNKKNILELHSEMTGLTKYLFKFCNLRFINKNLKFIFLHRKLLNILKIRSKNFCILEDAVEKKDFNNTNPRTKFLTCAYSGSFAKGKGIELIYAIANKAPKINFDIFGNIKTLNHDIALRKVPRNIRFKGFLSYRMIANTLPRYKVLLMPYQKNVGVLVKRINVASYFSPLKLFEYMATGKTIIASNLKVYNKILKNNHNSIILDPKNTSKWIKTINEIFKSNKYNHLGKNAQKDVKKYSWANRVDKIITFSKLF